MIERPPLLLRLFMCGALFRKPQAPGERTIYLTFDDGPIPQATPQVLDCLRRHGARATFFMVGDNARRYPALVKRVVGEGHAVGNHTMHHIKGLRTSTEAYLADMDEAMNYLPAGAARLFRPPHGLMRPALRREVAKRARIVLYDVLTRDYAPSVSADDIVITVKRLARPGSIIVLHDSLRSIDKLHTALPRLLTFLKSEGYDFGLL